MIPTSKPAHKLFSVSVFLLISAILICMVTGIDLNYGLFLGMLGFMFTAISEGHHPGKVLGMMWSGIKDSFIVNGILLLVSAMTGIWRANGTIPYLVVLGLKLIHPRVFILCAFLLCAATSYLIGTSFGTVGTIGVIMMTLCRFGNGNMLWTAGAVISGAYFGDRCSPASSCSHLVAFLTDTEIYDNVREMLKDVVLPTILAAIIYAVVSFCCPLSGIGSETGEQMAASFSLTPRLLLPAAVILLSPLFRLPIWWSMTASILIAAFQAVTIQGIPWSQIPEILVLGFKASGSLKNILSGGGMITMFTSTIMIIITATYSGIFNHTDLLAPMESLIEKVCAKMPLFAVTIISGLLLAMISCTQTLALMLQAPLLDPIYKKRGLSRTQFMLDIADSTVVLAGVIPWCLAISNPLKVLAMGNPVIPCSVFLFLIPLCRLFHTGQRDRSSSISITEKGF